MERMVSVQELVVGTSYKFVKTYSAGPNAGRIDNFVAEVTLVEDRGDCYYVGYRPQDLNYGRFGYLSVKKVGKYRAINYTFYQNV